MAPIETFNTFTAFILISALNKKCDSDNLYFCACTINIMMHESCAVPIYKKKPVPIHTMRSKL